MKVLLLCMAFAAVSLAMPVAEEKVEPAAPAPTILVQADEKKSEPASEVKEPEKAAEPEPKSASVEIASVSDKAVTDTAPEVKENLPVAKAAIPTKPEEEKKPEVNVSEEPKPEDKLDSRVPEEGESKAVVEEIPNEVAPIQKEPLVGTIPMPVGRTDLPVVPPKDEAVVSGDEPAKPEDKPEVKAEEKSAKPAPEASADITPTDAKKEDVPRVVRDTVEAPASIPKTEKQAETKVEETKVKETKVEETKVEEAKVEEAKVEEAKVKETKDVQSDEEKPIELSGATPVAKSVPVESTVLPKEESAEAPKDKAQADETAQSTDNIKPIKSEEAKPTEKAEDTQPMNALAEPNDAKVEAAKMPNDEPAKKDKESSESSEETSSEESKEKQ